MLRSGGFSGYSFMAKACFVRELTFHAAKLTIAVSASKSASVALNYNYTTVAPVSLPAVVTYLAASIALLALLGHKIPARAHTILKCALGRFRMPRLMTMTFTARRLRPLGRSLVTAFAFALAAVGAQAATFTAQYQDVAGNILAFDFLGTFDTTPEFAPDGNRILVTSTEIDFFLQFSGSTGFFLSFTAPVISANSNLFGRPFLSLDGSANDFYATDETATNTSGATIVFSATRFEGDIPADAAGFNEDFAPGRWTVVQTDQVTPPAIPLPAPAFLLLGGLGALVLAGRRRLPA
ncbi:MAG: hypothetical protein AAGP08_00475 [Pseudomonadota bacterium]